MPRHSPGGQLVLEYGPRYPATRSHLMLLDTGGDSRWPQQNAAGQRRQVGPAGPLMITPQPPDLDR